MLNDIDKFDIENLVSMGGFTHRRIAAYIFKKDLGKVSVREVRTVSAFIAKRHISVWTWRNGLNASAQAKISELTNGRRNKKAIAKRKSA